MTTYHYYMMRIVCAAARPQFTLLPFLGVLLFVAHGAEQPATWPLWDGKESTLEYAQRVNLPSTKTLDLGNGVKLETVLIPAGKFLMGSPEREKPFVGQLMLASSGFVLLVLIAAVFIRAWKKRTRPQYSLRYLILMTWVASICVWGGVRWWQALQHTDDYEDERPAHVVTLTKPFYMGKYTVTQAQYQQVLGTNPSNFKGNNLPVENVSWDEAQEFCKKVNAASAQAVRLPTEAEWEYACRAGTSTKYYSGDTEEDLKRVAWYYANSNNTTHPAGQKEPNKFGLYDMHGNVWQGCQDWYGDYTANEVVDPQGAAQGVAQSNGCVLRGGAWHFEPCLCRSACRVEFLPDYRNNFLGFRVVVPASRTP